LIPSAKFGTSARVCGGSWHSAVARFLFAVVKLEVEFIDHVEGHLAGRIDLPGNPDTWLHVHLRIAGANVLEVCWELV
jgi:hypothetical protein